MSPEKAVVKQALSVRTFSQAQELGKSLIRIIGGEYKRPVGDIWKQSGIVSGSGGEYDHKLIEGVTNMQDAVLERVVLSKYQESPVPFKSPREAAKELREDVSKYLVQVEFHESDPPTRESKRLTVIFRDNGCGLTAEQIPKTIFAFGSSHKEEFDWLQGAFGMGGKVPYGNSKAVVLVTRRAPELLKPNEEDRIVASVVLWEKHKKTNSIFYLVTDEWKQAGDVALPFSVPAHDFPEFEPGTHLALISYGVEGFHRARAGGDESGFEAVLNTRLFQPITTVSFLNKILKDKTEQVYHLNGLKKRMEDNPREERKEAGDVLPFNAEGVTYLLPINYYVFPKSGDRGAKRRFVAKNHALVFTSNGQVHYHWAPLEFKSKTRFRKLHDRIFVVVETDNLPIDIRTNIFTSDRSRLVHNDHAVRLEKAVIGFLDESSHLREIEGEIIREAIMSHDNQRPAVHVAKQISRALSISGFSPSGPGSGGGGKTPPGTPGRTRAIKLLNDPTYIKAHQNFVAEEGETKFINFTINALNEFIPKRGELIVVCTHPEISTREITTGRLQNGRIRVSIAVPSGAELGKFHLRGFVDNWHRMSGGIGDKLSWESTFEVIEEGTRQNSVPGEKEGKRGADLGKNVAFIWDSHEKKEDWSKRTVGSVEMVSASILAKERPEYEFLSDAGDMQIPTISLNTDYYALKNYTSNRGRSVTERGVEMARDRYAIGVGVGLCMLFQESEKRNKEGNPLSEDMMEFTKECIAKSVLNMMPEYDKLAEHAGIED